MVGNEISEVGSRQNHENIGNQTQELKLIPSHREYIDNNFEARERQDLFSSQSTS